MEFPKFRELIIDPFTIKFKKNIIIKEIINYPHATNDVIDCIGYIDSYFSEFIIKFSRHIDSDLLNESQILVNLNFTNINSPELIEFGFWGDTEYLVTRRLRGKRLSFILNEYTQDIENYCYQFGENIGKIHNFNISWSQVKKRKFHDIAKSNSITNFDYIYEWLLSNKPKTENKCFIHGDHHYANILWNDGKISGTIDWELCGIGNKEYDLAWSICLRPGQNFFLTKNEEYMILKGYQSQSNFNQNQYNYYKIQIMHHFLNFKISNEDLEYKRILEDQIQDIIENRT